MSLDELRNMAEEEGADPYFLDMLADTRAFRAEQGTALSSEVHDSRLPGRHLEKCLESRVARKLKGDEVVRGGVPLFDVPKKDPQVRRLIVDGRPVNEAMERPPRFLLSFK